MGDIKEFYKETRDSPPHKKLKKLLEIENIKGKAIDLGCGAGRDTIFLIKNGWNVCAIDRENSRELITEKLEYDELKMLNFSCQDFESIELEKCDLIVAFNSIPFCNKNNFNKLWNNIVESILQGGYFVGTLFGVNDSWVGIKKDRVFLTKDQVLGLFEEFKIIDFEEIEKDAKTVLGQMKHWHIFEVIAKKM